LKQPSPQQQSGERNATPKAPVKIIAFANQKGGVGKTTSAVNTAAMLASRGYRVLLLDMDPQGNATSSLGIDKQEIDASIYDVLVDDAPITECRIADVRPRLDVLPTTSALAAGEIELVNVPDRERRLVHACSRIRHEYDIALIDCPPSLGLLTINALTASHSIVVPIQCEFLALEGVSQLIHTIDLTRRQLNPTLDLLGVLMTMYDARTRLSAHVVEEVRRFFPDRIFETVVPRSVRLAEAPSYGQAISEYDPGSRGGSAYGAFSDELVARLGLVQPDATNVNSSR
jgi:chromosome partitioning protein